MLLNLGPATASAQADAAAAAIAVPTAVVANSSFTSVMQYLKSFTLDKIATMVAKQILHQMTASTINWINSGFKGSPAFLSNPQAFFLDAADQVTGAFLSGNGPLSQLCSPFSVDIRVALALDQAGFQNQRYACTLGTIVRNVQNGTAVTVNGHNLNSFMNGNFSAGGWTSFITMTTVPQNNPFGAYLQSSADLNSQIGMRHASLSADLQLGNGFLSWDSCQNVSGTDVLYGMQDLGLTQADAYTVQNNGLKVSTNGSSLYNSNPNTVQVLPTGQSTSYKATTDASGHTTYQDCETQTPGSVISSKLMTSINSPEVEAELANDINSVINALVSQMASQMLNQGLRSLSSGGSGVSSYGGGTQKAYTAQLYTDATSAKPAGFTAQQSLPTALVSQSPAVQSLSGMETEYGTAVTDTENSQAGYQTALSCYNKKLPTLTNPTAVAFAQYQISSINTVLTTIGQQLQTLQSKQTAIQNQIAAVASSTNVSVTTNIDPTQDIETQIQNYQNAASSIINLNSQAISTINSGFSQTTVDSDLKTAQTNSSQYDTASASALSSCNSLSDSYANGQIISNQSQYNYH